MLKLRLLMAAALIALGGCVPPKPESQYTNRATGIWSPCQCRAAGDDDCYLPSTRRPLLDGTLHADYDAWGYYHGEVEVPAVCRRPE